MSNIADSLRKDLHAAIDSVLKETAANMKTLSVDVLLEEGYGVQKVDLGEFVEWMTAKGSVQCSYGTMLGNLNKFAMRKRNAELRAAEKK